MSQHRNTPPDSKSETASKDFDHRYLSQQKDSHKNAVTMFRHYRDNGEDRALRDLTAAELPILQRHLDEVDRLIGMVGA